MAVALTIPRSVRRAVLAVHALAGAAWLGMLAAAVFGATSRPALLVMVSSAAVASASGAVLGADPRIARWRWVRLKFDLTLVVVAVGAACLILPLTSLAVLALRCAGLAVLTAVLTLSVLKPFGLAVRQGRHRHL